MLTVECLMSQKPHLNGPPKLEPTLVEQHEIQNIEKFLISTKLPESRNFQL